MSNPTTPFSWQMPTSTDLVTDLPADFEVFGQAVATSMADLLGGTTGQILSKASNTDMDFTWIANDQGDITAVNVTSPITGGGNAGAVTVGIQAASTSQSGAVQLENSTSSTSTTTAAVPASVKSAYDLANTANTTAGAAIPKSTVTAKGSIVTATAASTPANLSVGNADQILTTDSTTSTGLKWSAGAWTSYTPTLYSITQGNGSLVARYTQIGKVCFVFFVFELGTTSSVSTTPGFSLPVTSNQSARYANGDSLLLDTGVAEYYGKIYIENTTRASFFAQNASGTYVKDASVTSAVPFTWGTGDKFTANFWYEVA